MIEFTVYGEAKTAGSKRAFYNPKIKRAIVTDDNKKSRDWKEQVASAAHQAYQGELLRGPLRMRLTFYRVRPQGHYKSDGSTLNKKGRECKVPATKPDLLKLTRAVEDALKGIVYVDDSQITTQLLSKRFGEPARVDVYIDGDYK